MTKLNLGNIIFEGKLLLETVNRIELEYNNIKNSNFYNNDTFDIDEAMGFKARQIFVKIFDWKDKINLFVKRTKKSKNNENLLTEIKGKLNFPFSKNRVSIKSNNGNGIENVETTTNKMFVKYLKEARGEINKKLIKLESLRDKTKNKVKKEQIFISKEIGIYKEQNGKKLNYPIKGERANLLRRLKDGKKDGKLLAELSGHKNLQQLSKDINDINRIFKKKLKLRSEIIIHVETGGYRLNKEKYKIKFI